MRRFTLLLLATLPVFANTISTAQIDGFGTTFISGSADAEYLNSSPLDPTSLSPFASANSITDGPERPGFIWISASGYADGGTSQVTIGTYSFVCDGVSCHPNGFALDSPLAFVLGDPFHVTISANANKFNSGSGQVDFSFFVTEGEDLDYALVVVNDPPDVPEPTTMLLSAGGLALLVVGKRIRQRV